MGPLNSCANNCFSVNFVRHDDAILHQQMERMFRNDFNEPMVASKTAMYVEDNRALAQNGSFSEDREWSLSTGVTVEKEVCMPSKQSRICYEETEQPKETLSARSTPV